MAVDDVSYKEGVNRRRTIKEKSNSKEQDELVKLGGRKVEMYISW